MVFAAFQNCTVHRLRKSRLALAALVVFLPPVLQAQTFYYDDSQEKPWVELQAELPKFPESANLVRIPLESMKAFEVAVDAKSISIGEDGVIRFVLVATSSSGARNVSFEGIRCETRERRLLAIGKADSTWGAVRSSKWISYADNPRSPHTELSREYFCPRLERVRTVGDALENIRRGGVSRSDR